MRLMNVLPAMVETTHLDFIFQQHSIKYIQKTSYLHIFSTIFVNLERLKDHIDYML